MWTDAASAVLDAASACHFAWTAAAGVTGARLRVPAVTGVLAGYSPVVSLSVK